MAAAKKAAVKKVPNGNDGEILASSIDREDIVPAVNSEEYVVIFYDKDGDYHDSTAGGTCLEEAMQRTRAYFDNNSSDYARRAILFKKFPILTILNDLH